MSTSPDVFTNRHAAVTVTTETVELRDGAIVPIRFRIASDSGYLASLPACGVQHGVEDKRKTCPRPYGHPRDKASGCNGGSREHCHNWHADSARRFAGEVLATYGAKRKPVGAVGAPRGYYQAKHFVPLREPVAVSA